jgi:hypothetical protein
MIAHLAQYLVVGLIVLLAALYAAGKYLPASIRRRVVYRFSDGSGKGWLARWLDKDASCGSGCDTCGSCAPEPMAEQDEKGRKVIQVHLKR